MPAAKKKLPALRSFAAFPPESAREFAAKAQEVAAQTPAKVFASCKLCGLSDRETVDYLILIDASLDQLRSASGLDYAPEEIFKEHRDKHLMPLIKALLPNPMMRLTVPYPEGGNRHDKERWHFWRFWALQELAVRSGNINAGIAAGREMRLIDMGIGLPPAGKAVLDGESRRVGEVDPPKDREAAILERFETRVYRSQEDEVRNEDGTDAG